MSDLIKRSDAIKELSKAFANCEPCDKEEASDIAVTTIKELPSADRPPGKWEFVPYKRIDEHGEVVIDGYSWRCSNCGDARKRNEPDMNFCPNCGAYMRGVSDDN